MNSDVTNNYTPTERQLRAHTSTKPYKLYGGAVGGGKTVWLCQEAIAMSLQFPGNRGLICRYHLGDLKRSTLVTLFKWLPEKLIKNHNKTEGIINLTNGSIIEYMGLSEETAKQKIGSMELGWFAIDEACEVSQDSFLFLQSRLRRWKLPNGEFPPHFGLLASNPADCWLKDYFLHGGGGNGAEFIQAKPSDNPHLHEDYEKDLRKIYPEDWVKRFLDGSWDDLSAGDVVIPNVSVRAAINREIPISNASIVAADIARFGDDEIVIYGGKGNCLLEQDIKIGQSLMETTGRIVAMKEKLKANLIVVDDAALGGGVTDRLREQKHRVLPINGGTRAIQDTKFANLKSEIWWYAREQFKEGKVSILNDPKLIRQLSGVKYLYRSNGKIMIEPKKEMKARLGYSPDRADAFVLMLWGAKHIKDPARDFLRKPKVLSFWQKKIQTPYGWSREVLSR